ncbi:hypothetical protein [Azospirillum sp. sgz302134]
MPRFAPAFLLSLPLALPLALGGAGGALGQTVADFDAALAAAPVIDAQPSAAESYCRPVLNYVFTSIPADERSGWVLPLVTLDGSADPAIVQKRTVCEKVRQSAVIQFDAGTGEPIVTPPKMSDVSRVNGPYDMGQPGVGGGPTAAPADGTQRRTGRRPAQAQPVPIQ